MAQHPSEILLEHSRLVQRVAAGRAKADQAYTVLAEINTDEAVKAAALHLAQYQNLDGHLPALTKVVVVSELSEKLLAALRAELIELPENDLAAFKKLYTETLKNYGGIT
jgi:hypothetical protein